MRIDQFISGSAVDRLTDVLLLAGPDGSILDANAKALEFYGYSRPEILALNLSAMRAPGAEGDSYARLVEASDAGLVFESEHRRSDGGPLTVEVRSAAVSDHGETALFIVVRDIGAARIADEALRDREWRLASIVEATHVGTWESNVQTGRTIFNATWAEIVGYTLDELAPLDITTWETLVHPDDRVRSDDLLARHFAGETPVYECECRMRHKSGAWIWVHDRGQLITRDENGEPLMMFGTHLDITERKNAEQALIASEARSAAIISASPVPIITTDESENIVYVNPAFVRTYGYDLENVPTLEAWRSAAYPDTAYRHDVVEAWKCELDEMRRTGEEFSAREIVVTCKDGTSKTVLATAAIFSDSAGSNNILVLYDISGRKAAEEALRESEERLRSILEASPDDILIADLGGRIRLASPKARKMFGFARSRELPGHSILEFIVPEDRDRAAGDLALLLQEVKEGPTVYRATAADGRAFDIEITGDLIRDAGGQASKLVFVVRDVTERRRSEKALVVSDSLMTAIFDQAPLGIALVDSLTGRMNDVNPTFARIVGRSAEELRELDWMSITHPDDMQANLENVSFMNAGETDGFAMVKRFVRGDGETVWAHMTITPLQVGDAASPRHLCMLQDITADREVQEELVRQQERIGRTLTSVIDMASNIVETRDPYTAGHQRRVAELAERIAMDLHMTMVEVEDIKVAGLIHDVGKIKVPAEILGKPGEISTAERDILKDHPETGYRIITSASLEAPIAEMVYQHHERCDGSGYPRGLTGEQMLRGAKVLAVADVVEAMMSNRPYRPALGIDAALAEIEQGAGTLYDADVARSCVAIFREQAFRLSSPPGDSW